ncbi:hypothetical protein SCHIN_v1c06910 [Spiroplasma chinense]|uniref:Uncharacterized protein n=1 Tax=Spiroplasma chinense TaxID=216932 RepID=A0A5B9Y402_9MOLU|nr:hypothetical protein [Spiroplasma chinense]QEH61888.1 hypothetical protein SCHIN_v1c06910 [Spiroplasma chinense]
MRQDKKITNYFIGLLIIVVLDGALTLSIGTRSIIYLAKGIWIAPIIQFIPLIFFATLFAIETIFITKYFKNCEKYKKAGLENFRFKALKEIEDKNIKKFKKTIIVNYIACGLTVCLGFLGLVPLFFMISGTKQYNFDRLIEQNKNNK